LEQVVDSITFAEGLERHVETALGLLADITERDCQCQQQKKQDLHGN